MHRCDPYPELVGASLWLPAEAFDYGWAPLIGCNHLRCSRCGQPVSARVLGDGVRRHYACRCQRKDESGRFRLGEDDDEITSGPTGWYCDGHPDLALPADLDGVALAEDGDWAAVARLGLARPPFLPPQVERYALWITRLYRVLGDGTARRRLGEAVADLTDDPDIVLVAGALDFFINEPAAAGAGRLAALVQARRAWLEATTHPQRPDSTLLETLALVLHQRLLVVGDDGRPVDRAALAATQALALDGIGPGGVPYSLLHADPDWLWDHAADLVRANRYWLGRIVQLSAGAPSATRLQALRAIAGVGGDVYHALCAKITQHVSEPERSALLAAVAPGAPGTGA